MPFIIKAQFDGGIEVYQRGLDIASEEVKSFKKLWQLIIEYFEGRSDIEGGSPVRAIWDSKGELIGGDWKNQDKYEKWKSSHWSELRRVSEGIPGGKWEQVLTGMELASLLSAAAPGAVRSISDTSMEYGTNIDYASKQQEKKKILDFYAGMMNGVDSCITKFYRQIMSGWAE